MDSAGGLQMDSFHIPHQFPLSQDAQSDPDAGSSSSLSDLENTGENDLGASGSEDEEDIDEEGDDLDDDQDRYEQDGKEPASDLNDSEAETERLENSPYKARRHRDVLLDAHAETRTFERSPSKLYQSHNVQHEQGQEELSEDEEDQDDEQVEDEEDADFSADPRPVYTRVNRNSASIMRGAEFDKSTITGLVRDSSFSKKRKRSLLPERRSSYPEDDEPATKRPARKDDDFAIDDTASGNEDNGASNTISGELSEVSSVLDDEEESKDTEMVDAFAPPQQTTSEESRIANPISILNVEQRRRSKSRKSLVVEDVNSIVDIGKMEADDIDTTHIPLEAKPDTGEEDEVDEAELALRNEAEQEKRQKSLELLAEIRRSYDKLRKLFYAEQIAQCEREEIMLRTTPATHPVFLCMVKTIDQRHDDHLAREKRLMQFQKGAIERTAVATRAQILSQFHQEVRDIRERSLEKCGKAWYDIQSDRRSFGSQPEKYPFAFPTKKTTQIMQHNQYTKEVSLLSGIAKNVGFPAAPSMNGATREEIESDLEKLGQNYRRKQIPQRSHQAMPNLAALRAATFESSLKPAEERFIEQNAWANPQHPSNAHLTQRQPAAHHTVRNGTHFTMGGVRRQPHHHIQQQPHHHHHHHHPHQSQHHHQMSSTPTLALFNSSVQNANREAIMAHMDRTSRGSPFDHTQHLKARVALPVNSMENRQATKTPEIPRETHVPTPATARKPLPMAPIHATIEASGIKRE